MILVPLHPVDLHKPVAGAHSQRNVYDNTSSDANPHQHESYPETTPLNFFSPPSSFSTS